MGPHDGIRVLIRRDTSGLCLVRTRQEGGRLPAREKDLAGNDICPEPSSWTSRLRNVRKYVCGLRHPAYGLL